MLGAFFPNTIYIKVHPNRFELKNVQTGKTLTLSAHQAFTTKRQLVGQFAVAEDLLKKGVAQLAGDRFSLRKPVAVIQPMSMIEGGLSQVEERVLLELAAGAGAKQVVVWVGHELSGNEVLQRAKGAQT